MPRSRSEPLRELKAQLADMLRQLAKTPKGPAYFGLLKEIGALRNRVIARELGETSATLRTLYRKDHVG
jgi:hypothetical protein